MPGAKLRDDLAPPEAERLHQNGDVVKQVGDFFRACLLVTGDGRQCDLDAFLSQGEAEALARALAAERDAGAPAAAPRP